MLVTLIIASILLFFVSAKDEPKFLGTGFNITVVMGRDATLTCKVENLQSYKVAWLRVDTQTILTIGQHVITKNHRVEVSRSDSSWSLTLRDIRPTDGGRYMCQINTDPMITQTHHLHIFGKPTAHLSQKMTGAYIGETVSLRCIIEANPSPVVFWTHVVYNKLYNSSKYEMNLKSTEYKHTATLRVKNVTRKDIGSYYCYAENSLGTARDDVTVYTLATTTILTTSTEVTTAIKEFTITPIQTYAVAAIALPSGGQLNENFAGNTGIASEFGRTGDCANDGISSNQALRHVNLPIITNAECSRSFNIITAGNICTSGANRRSTCRGDSGSPLAVNGNNRPLLVGLTSFGSDRGCQQGFPAAYVRVTAFISWINARS